MWYYSAPHWHNGDVLQSRPILSTFRVTFPHTPTWHSHKSTRPQSIVSCGDNVASDWSAYPFQEMQNCLFLQLSLEYGYKTMRPSEKRSRWNCIRIEHFSSSYMSHILFDVGAWVVSKRVSQQGLLMLQLQSAMYRCMKYILPHPYIGLTRRIIVNLQHAGVAYCIGSTMLPCQTFHTVCNIAYLPMSNHRRRRRRRGNSGSDKSNRIHCGFRFRKSPHENCK